MELRRVVVTGLGAVSPLGHDVADTWDALVAGKGGVAPLSLFDASTFSVRIAAEVKDWDAATRFGRRRARHLDRFAQFGLAAATEAIEHAGFAAAYDPSRVGVVVGSGIGGLSTVEREVGVLNARGAEWVNPYLSPMMIPNMAAGEIAIEHGFTGPNTCPVTACAASGHAIGEGLDLIRLGRADVIVAGGAEAAITPIGMAGFAAAKALSTRNDDPGQASRPFDAGRDGFVCGEGAAVVILEERQQALDRGATILAELVGYGATSDAFHVTAPHPQGTGAMASMRVALADAGIAPEALDYINAHGTSTPPNDRIESMAVKAVVGTGVPMSSTKSMTGHLLGAAGALEAVACVQVLRTGILPPTVNYDDPDPACDLDYVPNQARRTDGVEVVMSNSFGFGGHNATLIFRAHR